MIPDLAQAYDQLANAVITLLSRRPDVRDEFRDVLIAQKFNGEDLLETSQFYINKRNGLHPRPGVLLGTSIDPVRIRCTRAITFQGPRNWVEGCMVNQIRGVTAVGTDQYIIGEDIFKTVEPVKKDIQEKVIHTL